MTSYRALQIQQEDTVFTTSLVNLPGLTAEDEGIVVAVEYSSINYKDGLSAAGNPGVTRKFPHVPGIDAVGVVSETKSDLFAVGDRVLVTGYDLGMNTDGGLAQQLKIPAQWALKLPQQLSSLSAMILGTAGLTAYLSIDRLERAGLAPGASIVISGAGGGVGSIAVAMAKLKGYKVTAISNKVAQYDWLTALGADEIIAREVLGTENKRALLTPQWDAGIDCAGGDTLANMVKSVAYGGHVAACGLAQSSDLPLTVLPFILNGIGLLGVDSVQLPLATKQAAWSAISELVNKLPMHDLHKLIPLAAAKTALSDILTGTVAGRLVVDVNA